MNRREFSRYALSLWPALANSQSVKPEAAEVNDIHSGLNATRVSGVETVTSADQLAQVLTGAKRNGQAISVAGGRHAMGGQQFGTDTVLVDTVKMRRVLVLDTSKGVVEVEAGSQVSAF